MGKPWTVHGDFNQVLQPSEKSASTSPNVDLPTHRFADSLHQSALTLGGTKEDLRPIAKKLHRVLVNEEWMLKFPLLMAVLGEPAYLDHASMSLSLQSGAPRQKKPFRFFNYLLQSEDFFPVVVHHCSSYNISGSAMFCVARKFRSLKKVIRDFSKSNYSDIKKRVDEAFEALAAAQVRTLADPSVANAENELLLHENRLTVSTGEESFFYQCYRVTCYLLVTETRHIFIR